MENYVIRGQRERNNIPFQILSFATSSNDDTIYTIPVRIIVADRIVFVFFTTTQVWGYSLHTPATVYIVDRPRSIIIIQSNIVQPSTFNMMKIVSIILYTIVIL